jgi:hypothetical protein
MSWIDLVLFSGSTYGAAWVLTRSKLLAPLRRRLAPVPLLGYLVSCIVCTGAWVALGLSLLLPRITLLALRPSTLADHAVLVTWAVAVTWAVGSRLGDAD